MSKETITVVKRQSDGRILQILDDGSTQELVDTTDWEALRAMSDEAVEAAALADPDAQPVTEQDAKMHRVPRIRPVR